MDDEDRQHLKELLETHRKNLRHLEKQAAKYGAMGAPLYIYNAIEEEKKEIFRIQITLDIESTARQPLPKRSENVYSAPPSSQGTMIPTRSQQPTVKPTAPARTNAEDRQFTSNTLPGDKQWRSLMTILIAIGLITLIGLGLFKALQYSADQQIANLRATATPAAPTIVPIQTQTTQATTTRIAQRTATAIVRQPTPEPSLGIGVVINGGNLRKEAPRGEVIGLLWAGDQVTFLEQQQAGGQSWFLIRLTKPSPDRDGQGVAAGAKGWASAVLLSLPTPPAAP